MKQRKDAAQDVDILSSIFTILQISLLSLPVKGREFRKKQEKGNIDGFL